MIYSKPPFDHTIIIWAYFIDYQMTAFFYFRHVVSKFAFSWIE